MRRNYQVLSKKKWRNKTLDCTPLHQLQPSHNSHSASSSTHTPLPTLSLSIRSAVSQTPPAPASHRKEADHREKPTVSQTRKRTCEEQPSHTQRCFSKLSAGFSLPPWPVPSHLSCFAYCRTQHTASVLLWAGLHCKTCKV